MIMTFFISQCTVFLKQQNDDLETTGKLIENIPNDDSWHFLALSFKQSNDNLELVYSVDANTLELIIVKKSSFWNKKVTVDIRYNKTESKGEYSLKIANFHLMPPFNKELLENIYDFGVTKTDDFPLKPILEVTEFEDLNQKKTNSFLDIFVRNLGCQSLMPLLLYNKMIYKDKKGEYPVIFDTAIQVISGVLHHSIESENMFVENDGIPILYNLLSKVWINTITVKNYNSLFNLFCDLQTENLKNLFFETILVNFDFLSKISKDTQLQIYRQWEINFIAISFDYFSKFCNMKLIFASILQYFSEKQKIRKILLNICESFYFKDLKQFDTLCSTILHGEDKFGLISDLLNLVSNFVSLKYDENIIYLPSFRYILLYSLKFEQVQSKVFSILFLLNEEFIEKFTLNIISQKIEISQENKSMILDKFEPKLLPLFIFLFENNFTIFKNLFSVFLKKFEFKNCEKWFLYLIANTNI
ncbi:hypothetical protein TVAG_042020 [Trichomonas vaginalis G3]|uniref:Uncharacterized protein n=1 Tax=Trichomonas vaginalis (strain ATCC PRA-98 / G3) TaxID=412133 RepID=A2EUU1_TRIV3|nr:platelet formation protein family [Trichomonas vaginalis G3]EAY03550.1 hypothetical protein TVAG_042020 [Trichomonas vaginalis G3]KAI5550051.1 platelet formation protein family [Trichomonas vaginalis G3]|eukprot:XP_001315773.1 hypothetical protein [Trichomonas vaginalis G3]